MYLVGRMVAAAILQCIWYVNGVECVSVA